MHCTVSRLSARSDINLEALPAKSVLLSAAKRLLICLYDENYDDMFALTHSEEGVSHSQSVDQDQSRTATLFEKLEGAIKTTECIPKTVQTGRAISRGINWRKDSKHNQDNGCIRIHTTHICRSRKSFFSGRTVYHAT